jgi:hypothetical protein
VIYLRQADIEGGKLKAARARDVLKALRRRELYGILWMMVEMID